MKQMTIATAFASTGAHPLTVSCPALGIAGYGDFSKAEENKEQLRQYLALGGNLVDTAHVYGTWIDESRTSYSEKILGSFLSEEEHSRLYVSTKGAHPVLETMEKRVTPACIRKDLEESLANLCTECIDIYFLHRDDPDVPVSVIMDALNRHAEKGQIHLLGASNWAAPRIYQANDYCVQHGMRGFDLSQVCFNILHFTPAVRSDPTQLCLSDEDYRICLDMHLTVMAFTAQAGGYVSKFYHTPDAEVHSPYASEETFARMRRIRILCEEAHLTPTEVTLGYLLSQKLPVIPIIGASRSEQLKDCMTHADVHLTEEQLAWIDGR